MSEKFTAYVTTYALSAGIQEIPVELCPDIGPTYLADRRPRHFGGFKLGATGFRTLEEAAAEAERMRVAKITSLKKQIAKLEKLSFGKATP